MRVIECSRGGLGRLERVERRSWKRTRGRGLGRDQGTVLNVFVAATTFKTNCLPAVSQLAPFSATATRVLEVNRPELFGFCWRYGRATLRFCRIPDCIYYQACPQSGGDYPQVRHEQVGHVFHLVYFCSPQIQYVRDRTYSNIEYAILRYKPFGVPAQ